MLNNMNRVPFFLLAVYLVEFGFLAVSPYSREIWFAENLPIILIVLGLIISYRKYQFSSTAYFMMFVLIFLHTIGGHYTFERVPFGFVSELFGFERNHFDRIAHFSVGFYAYAMVEFIDRKRLTNSRWMMALFGVFFIFTVAAVYEIIEWIFAVSNDPEAGIAFLGSQNDVWDAQKDMLADGLGSIFAVIVYWLKNQRNSVRN